MTLSINVTDTLRAQVEAASGGLNTVLYTDKGQPCFMRVIPKTLLQDLDSGLGTGTHPAFIVDSVEKDQIYLGLYPGRVKNGELVSQPSLEPTVNTTHDSFVSTARANGTGWHCMTNIEWALLGAICYEQGFQPRGNNDDGQDHSATDEVGIRPDGLEPGDSAGNARTLGGSGPTSWRHDNSPFGIADLNGNVWEWSPGMRINAGEIQVLPNNDAALNDADLSSSSTEWKAIDGSDGSLVAPGSANAVKYNTTGTANYTLVRASGSSFEGMTNPGGTPVHADALEVLKAYGLYPLAGSALGGDGFYLNTSGERVPLRGGNWNGGAVAGVFALRLLNERSYSSTSLGARPAFVS